jgi:UDP-GlcNAc:undecaprenyl-phosphate GlcNAc-1-phosphate transferase
LIRKMNVSYLAFVPHGIQAPLLAGLSGAALTAAIKLAATRLGCFGVPRAHHTHKNPVPRVGGIAIYAAVVFALVLPEGVASPRITASPLLVLLGALPVLLVGIYDDLRGVGPKLKVLAQVLGTIVLVIAKWRSSGAIALLPTFLLLMWMVVATNSFNLIDGVDGLAATTAVIVAIGLAVVNFSLGNVALATLALITASACLGFLPFNVLGKRIFLGDSGSLSVGFILAAIAFETPSAASVPISAIFFFGYPLAETLLTIARRTIKGGSPLHPDCEHLHHQLRQWGSSAVATDAMLCSVALAFMSLGVMLALGSQLILAVGSGCVLFLMLAKTFGYFNRRKLMRWRQRGLDRTLFTTRSPQATARRGGVPLIRRESSSVLHPDLVSRGEHGISDSL